MSTTAMTTDQRLEGQSAEERETAGTAVEALSTDRMFHLLQNERRRLTLQYLQGTEGVVDMREIVENVAATEYGTEIEQLTSTERQRVYIALYQSHLPKLADSGVIEYDQSRGWVKRTPLADDLDPYLTDDTLVDDEAGVERAWDRYYLSASAVAAIVLVAAWAGILSPISGFGIAAVVVAGFLGIALAHSLSRP